MSCPCKIPYYLLILAWLPVKALCAVPVEKPPQLDTNVIDTDQILALNTTMRSMVDLFAKPISNKERRAQAVYDIMFGADKFALEYNGNHTKTAIETVEGGGGDCVSLANTFIALARYADLKANYLDVRVPENWQRELDIYYLLKHISAVVEVGYSDYLGIEYEWMGPIAFARPRIVSDQEAFGSFYSNRGIELLIQDKYEAAMAYLKRSIEVDPGNSNNWSNLGVAYRRLNQLDQAEKAYLKALSKDKSDLTALNNLAILYQMTGKSKLADKYDKKLERYRRKNPYYLIKAAKNELEAGDYAKALKLAKKAIKKNDTEHEFYFVAAKAYAHLGHTKDAMESLKKAEKYALEARNKDLYSKKLEMLRNLRKSRQ